MDVSYLVKGSLSQTDIDSEQKQIIYSGCSPRKAFSFRAEHSEFAKLEVDFWKMEQLSIGISTMCDFSRSVGQL